ncbi:hypothetical protein ACFVUW_25650 [Streptomyces xiamenensis]|uniref:SecDF P1 head subdomain-containing protein n=1 Tax=Streptomyces xiamenensis TaxID=408015 RepID=UPI0036E9BC82
MSGIAGGTGNPAQPPWPPYPPAHSTPGGQGRSPGPYLLISALIIVGALLGFLAYQSASGKQEQDRTEPGGDPAAPLYIHAVDDVLADQECPAGEQSGGTAVFAPDITSCLILDTVTHTMTVDRLLEVAADYDTAAGGWLIQLTFTAEDGALFGDLTEAVAARPVPQNQLAMLLDGELLTAPSVMARIDGGQVQISGGFTREEAEALAARLAP